MGARESSFFKRSKKEKRKKKGGGVGLIRKGVYLKKTCQLINHK